MYSSFSPDIAGMMIEYLLTKRRRIKMGIDLCCPDILMPEHRLDSTKIGTSLKQGSGERMSESMR
jgi:hypothetical protein